MVAVVIVSMTALAAPRTARAAPCLDCNAEKPVDVSAGLPRTVWVKWAVLVDSAFTAFDVQQELRTGKRNNLITGLQFVATVPVAIYGTDYLRADKGDALAWGLTAWSCALMAHGFWPVIKHELDSAGVDVPTPKVKVAPTTVVSWENGQPHTGLGLGFEF